MSKHPPRYWLAVCPSGKVSEIQSGGTDTAGPIMLPACSNQDLPSWIRYVPYEDLAMAEEVSMEQAKEYAEDILKLTKDCGVENIEAIPLKISELQAALAEAEKDVTKNLDRAHSAEEKLDSAIYMVESIREWAQEDGAVFEEIRKKCQEFVNRYKARAKSPPASRA